MIKRNLSKYTKIHENLQTASFVASQGINLTKAPTIREYVKDINNLDVSENGALTLRKTINAKTFGEGTPLGWNYNYTLYVYCIKNTLRIKNNSKDLTIKVKLNASTSNTQLDNLTIRTLQYATSAFDFSNATLINTATTTLLCNVKIKNPYSGYYFVQNDGQYTRTFKIYTETINDELCAILEAYTPEYSYLDSSKTDVLVANMNSDDAYNISDTYNTGAISIEGILGYAMAEHPTDSKDVKPILSTNSSIDLKNTVRQCLCSLNNIKLTPFTTISENSPIILKAFMNLSTITTTMGEPPLVYTYTPYICTWEYTFDGINYYTVPSFEKDNNYDTEFKSFKCLVLDNTKSNITLDTDGTSSSDTVSRREITARKFKATGLDDIVNTRTDILYIPNPASLKGCTYRFTIYKINDYEIDVNVNFENCSPTSNEYVSLETYNYNNLNISATLDISNIDISKMIDSLKNSETLDTYLNDNLNFDVTVDYLAYDLYIRSNAGWTNLESKISEWKGTAKTDTATPYKNITVSLPQEYSKILPMYLVRVKVDYKYKYESTWIVKKSYSKIICVHTIKYVTPASITDDNAIAITNTDVYKIFDNNSDNFDCIFGVSGVSSPICPALDVTTVDSYTAHNAFTFYPCTDKLPISSLSKSIPYIYLDTPKSITYTDAVEKSKVIVKYVPTDYSGIDNYETFKQLAICINNSKLQKYITDNYSNGTYSCEFPKDSHKYTYFKLYNSHKLVINIQLNKISFNINLADFAYVQSLTAPKAYHTIAIPCSIDDNDIFTNLLITCSTNRTLVSDTTNTCYWLSTIYNTFSDYYTHREDNNVFDMLYYTGQFNENVRALTFSKTRLSNFTKLEESKIPPIMLKADIIIDEGSYSVSYTDTPEFLYTLKSIYSDSQQSNFKYLYYKYKLFTYGGSILNNNILMSDSDSITTPIMNTIDLYASNNSQVTSLTAWRDYLIAATNTTIHLISFNDSGTTSKIINTYVGIPESDSETLRSILNGVIFKAGNKIYTLNPNAYSSDDTLLSLTEISKPVANYVLTENVKKSFAITTTDAYYLFMALENSTEVLKYEFTRALWNRYTLPKSFIDYDLNDIDNIILYDSTGSSYEFNKECVVDIPNNEFYGDTLFDSDGQIYRKAFEFSVDSGEKTTTLMITKQYVESKLIMSPLNNPDIFPIDIDIYVDGFNTFSKHIDCSSDHSMLQNTFSPPTESQSIALLNTNINTNNSYVEKTLRQEFIRYSLKGKTIRHVISGKSYSNFELFVVYYKYKESHVKQ